MIQVEVSHLSDDHVTSPLKHRNRYTWKTKSPLPHKQLASAYERSANGRYDSSAMRNIDAEDESHGNKQQLRHVNGCLGNAARLVKKNLMLSRGQRELELFLARKGYKLLTAIGEDFIFVRNNFNIKI